jgi:hypothetical protein
MRKLANSCLHIVDAEDVFDEMMVDIKCLVHPSKPGIIKIASENRDSIGIGQWINDSAQPDLSYIDDFSVATEELQRYQTTSLRKANCNINDSFWFVASKDIEEKEEIFVHFGFQWWLRKLMLAEKNPERRFLLYSAHDQSSQIFNLQKFYEYDDATCLTFLKRLCLMPQETIDQKSSVKEFLFGLTMKNVDMPTQMPE